MLRLGRLAFLFAATISIVSAQSTSTVAEGSLVGGPSEQGTCQRLESRTDIFECSNGSTCRWQSSSLNFLCTGGQSEGGTNGATADAETGPPGRECESHGDHWDCSDGSLCEIVEGAWMCEGGSSSHEGESESSGTCVVHGGHTHGDCSGSCNGVDLGEYDLDLHIVALFVILIGSLFGVLFPVICSSVVNGPVFRGIFFATKHFGTGVIICTAFVHLLYHSFIMFGNACLGELAFEPAAPAIALAGVYVVFSVDFFVMRWLRSRGERREAARAVANGDGPSRSISPSSDGGKEGSHDHLGHSHGPAREIETDYSSTRAHFDVLILEAGIIFHSIMIGVSLGASGGDQWIPLFIAIVFHQMFEGLALGSRIGQLVWKKGQGYKKWLMAMTFGLITPIGIAIGMGVHSSYNPNSGASLLSIGILDSISAGILLYGGIVECLYHDFMHSSLARSSNARVFAALFFVLAGSFCMAILGKWA
ncbi:uncharacterized protein JCM6883_002364 [Sporobolomyces salmoneus]|uniref:uncharacterized protein n=1 Tax=Sporobolomyces salmoneus TaxID=183962 RepID=UPI0031721917